MVGQVVSVRKRETDLFQTASVQPSANLAALRAVLIITNFNPVDINPLTSTHGSVIVSYLISLPVLGGSIDAAVSHFQPAAVVIRNHGYRFVDPDCLGDPGDAARMPGSGHLLAAGLVSIITALPFGAPLMIYLVIVLAIRLVNRRILEFPILGMLIVTIIGTFFQHFTEIVVLFVDGRALPFSQSIVLVTLPSVLLNLLFSLPVYALVTDLARWVFPVEVQI